jgi:hypothetical protein
MSSQSKKMRRTPQERNVHSSIELKVNTEHFTEVLETSSLKDMPLEERRREANKPLYLVRYE